MAGEDVIIGSRSQERAEKVAAELNAELGQERIRGLDNVRAAEAAEIIVLTVPYTAHLGTLEGVKSQAQGKIFIDVSVPLDPENPRRMKMPAAGSATEEAQAFFGPSTRVVAAFQNVAAHLLRDPRHAIDCDILVRERRRSQEDGHEPRGQDGAAGSRCGARGKRPRGRIADLDADSPEYPAQGEGSRHSSHGPAAVAGSKVRLR
jgi:NADPH-dependent F420 reductase